VVKRATEISLQVF